MNTYQIRFNKTRGQEGRGSIDHVWRVFEGDKEYLFKNLDITVPVKSEKDANGIDYNITCKGVLNIDKETSTAVITAKNQESVKPVSISPTQVKDLFPTPLGIFKLNREVSKTELDYLRKLEIKKNIGNFASADTTVLDSKKLASIQAFAESSLQTYFETVYKPKNNVSLRITQSWANYTKPGQYHHKHAHQNSFVSGVFYAQVKDTDSISFHKNTYNLITISPREEGLYNTASSSINVENGMLLIFPSSLMHMVDDVQGVHTRISVAFNTFPKGVLGDEASLNSLELG
jgi:uncharacterized protein (TIGR02466 family)